MAEKEERCINHSSKDYFRIDDKVIPDLEKRTNPNDLPIPSHHSKTIYPVGLSNEADSPGINAPGGVVCLTHVMFCMPQITVALSIELCRAKEFTIQKFSICRGEITQMYNPMGFLTLLTALRPEMLVLYADTLSIMLLSPSLFGSIVT